MDDLARNSCASAFLLSCDGMDLPSVSVFAHDPIRAFVEALLAKAGFAHAPEEERAETVSALTAEAQRRVGFELMQAIDPHSLQAFRDMAEAGASEDELIAFFDVRVSGAEERVRAALERFGQECLDRAERLRHERHL